MVLTVSVQIHCQLNTSGAASVQCEQQLRISLSVRKNQASTNEP